MRRLLLTRRTPPAAFLVGLVALAVAAAPAVVPGPVARAVRDCPPGTMPAEAEHERIGYEDAYLPQIYRGPEMRLPGVRPGDCVPQDKAESFEDLALRDLQMSAIRTAPLGYVPKGATLAAAEQRAVLAQGADRVPGASGKATPYGKGPLIFDDPRYDDVNGSGIVDATGRIDDLKYDPTTNRLFAAIGTGGVWMSEDFGESWRPIAGNLPSTVASAVAYTPTGGPNGTVIVLTGEHTFGGFAFPGVGAYYSHDLGKTWTRSKGVPGGTLGFALEIDPSDPKVVYAATGKGLRRSTDRGKTFKDVELPTGKCAGNYNKDRCLFANFVTDVVVKAPEGTGSDTDGRDVVAAVGWRAGTWEDPDGFIQSTHNGIFHSPTGKPGTFEFLDGLADAAGSQDRIGRVELGPAIGPQQDHDYLYAIVEDAVLFNGGCTLIDVVESCDPAGLGNPTVLNGVYSSDDFGRTWTQLADHHEMSQACAVNRSVFCIPGVIEPGVQAWYNLWIEPDPTKALAGVPTRVLLGLEEVWQSRNNVVPQNTELTSFEVIGSYYGSVDCLLVATNCAANQVAGVTTTHPDQHAGLLVPATNAAGDQTGDVTLFVGHDGGLSTQTANAIDDFDQNNWQLEQENGLQTLLPYSAVWAKDGVAYAGLQDNGTMRVDPEEDFNQYETIGADGTFVAVDPKNSDYAFESIQGGLMNVTTDGGQTWRDVEPPADNKRFVNPFVMDPLDPNHVTTGGQQINETLAGPNTADGEEGHAWRTVFDLGTVEPIPGAPGEDIFEPPANGMTAIDTRGDVTYVGYCGSCDILNTPYPFRNGIATNIRGEDPPEAGTPDGWHKVAPVGLPNRYITSLAIDPEDKSKKTVFATLGGYSRRWVGPGSLNDPNEELGKGHVFKSVDGGVSWFDISGNLPNIPAMWVEPRGDQLIVGTDHGVYLSSDDRGGRYAPLPGVPPAPITSVQLRPGNANLALIGTYGRSLWQYRFDEDPIDLPEKDPPPIGGGGGVPKPCSTKPLREGPFTWEKDEEGWTVSSEDPATTWTRQSPGAEDSEFSFAVAPYREFAETTLTSPKLNTPGGPMCLVWDNRFDIEGGGFDEVYVEWSSNGNQWTRVTVLGGQNVGFPDFSENLVEFDPPAGDLYVRFLFVSDFICSSPPLGGPLCARQDGYEGAFIDNVALHYKVKKDLCANPGKVPGKHLVGTNDRDVLRGTDKRDIICGLKGNDKLIGGGGNDYIGGGKGDDRIKGKAGADELRGRRGEDTIDGGKGDDLLVGGDGKDSCDGGSGKDKLKSCNKSG